jgi:hypothetical protein
MIYERLATLTYQLVSELIKTNRGRQLLLNAMEEAIRTSNNGQLKELSEELVNLISNHKTLSKESLEEIDVIEPPKSSCEMLILRIPLHLLWKTCKHSKSKNQHYFS